MEKGRNALKILTSKPTRKILLGRPRHGWEESITMSLKKMVSI